MTGVVSMIMYENSIEHIEALQKICSPASTFLGGVGEALAIVNRARRAMIARVV
jgi:hypothetical protein